MATTFTAWLKQELNLRGWDQAELAHRSRITPAQISRILSGARRPGPEACVGIARALGLPPEQVFRKAGLLPALPGPDDEVLLRELLEVVRQLNPEERRLVFDFALWRYRKQMDRQMDRHR